MAKDSITLSKALEGYFIAAHARSLSPATLAEYDNAFRKLETYLEGDPPIAAITPAQIRGFLNSLDAISAKTRLNHHTALSALWTWAIAEDLVDAHVIRKVQRPRPAKRAIIPYTEEQVKAMLAACDRTHTYRRPGKRVSSHARPSARRDRAIMLLLVDTGIRASELCDLTLADADLQSQQIIVMGKGRKERLLECDARTVQAIWRYLSTREDTARPTAPLFASRTGQHMDRHNLRHMLQATGRRAGVTGVTVHRFRHTFAINFLRNGGNVFALQRMLGHQTLDMVNRYLEIAQADIKEAHRIASPVANWRL